MVRRVIMAVALCALTSGSYAAGHIDIDMAMIANGDLKVFGRLTPPRSTNVMLDEKYDARSDQERRFSFQLRYHPESCVVTLKSESFSRQAVVGYCSRPHVV